MPTKEDIEHEDRFREHPFTAQADDLQDVPEWELRERLKAAEDSGASFARLGAEQRQALREKQREIHALQDEVDGLKNRLGRIQTYAHGLIADNKYDRELIANIIKATEVK